MLQSCGIQPFGNRQLQWTRYCFGEFDYHVNKRCVRRGGRNCDAR